MEKELKSLKEQVEKNTQKIDRNYKKVNDNANKINENLEKITRNSYALSILKDYKNQSRRYFIIWLITFIAFIISLGYIFFILTQ